MRRREQCDDEPYYYEFPAGRTVGHKVYIDQNDRFRVLCARVDRGRLIDENTMKFLTDYIDLPWGAAKTLSKQEKNQVRERHWQELVDHNRFLYVGRLINAYRATSLTIFRISKFTEFPNYEEYKAEQHREEQQVRKHSELINIEKLARGEDLRELEKVLSNKIEKMTIRLIAGVIIGASVIGVLIATSSLEIGI